MTISNEELNGAPSKLGGKILKKVPTKSELQVIARAKGLASVVFLITARVPAKFRFTLSQKLQNLAIEIVADLYMANDLPISGEWGSSMSIANTKLPGSSAQGNSANAMSSELRGGAIGKANTKLPGINASEASTKPSTTNQYEPTEREKLQRRALTNTRLIAYFVTFVYEQKAITVKQFEELSKMILEVQKLIQAWIKSDKVRQSGRAQTKNSRGLPKQNSVTQKAEEVKL